MAISEQEVLTDDGIVTTRPAAPSRPPTVVRPAPPAPQSRPAPYVAPVDRRQTDRIRPAFFLTLAAGFFALSVISTVAQGGVILEIGGVQLVAWQAAIVGLLVAGFITAGEFLTSESWLYFAFLAPDVALTVWWLWSPLLRWSTAAGAGTAGAIVGGILLGILSAWLPERVVMGQRRKLR